MKTKIIVIVGPTAVGKTALAIDLAQALNGEIIGGDSQQVYRQAGYWNSQGDTRRASRSSPSFDRCAGR